MPLKKGLARKNSTSSFTLSSGLPQCQLYLTSSTTSYQIISFINPYSSPFLLLSSLPFVLPHSPHKTPKPHFPDYILNLCNLLVTPPLNFRRFPQHRPDRLVIRALQTAVRVMHYHYGTFLA